VPHARGFILLVALVGIAGAVGAVNLVLQLEKRPCVGVPVVVKREIVAAHLWDLPVVAKPVLTSAVAESSWFTSYPPSGRDTYTLGPFVLEDSWVQPGNDAHTLGPRSLTLWVTPIEASDDTLWSTPIFSGPDYDDVVDSVELRFDANESVYALLPILTDSRSWGDRAATASMRGDLRTQRGGRAVLFALEHHPEGHRGPALPSAIAALGLLVLASLVALLAWRRARAFALPEGTVDDAGRIVPEGDEQRVDASHASLAAGQVVLFQARLVEPTYRTAGAPHATSIVPGSRASLRRRVGWMLCGAGALAMGALVLAAHALVTVRTREPGFHAGLFVRFF
jgi:hypothetical protein